MSNRMAFQIATADKNKFYAPDRVLALAPHLADGLPDGTVVRVAESDAAFTAQAIEVSHPQQFFIRVNVPVWQPHLTWAYIRVYDAQKARGLWSGFARNLIALAHVTGRPVINGQASFENGGYAMARGRFAVEPWSWPILQNGLFARLDALAPLVAAHAKNGAKAVARAERLINSDDPRSVWAVADLGCDCRKAFNVAADTTLAPAFYDSFKNTDMDEGNTRDRQGMAATILRNTARPTLGWGLLTRTTYPAQLCLSDQGHMDVLTRRYRDLPEKIAGLAAKARIYSPL